MSRWPKGVPKVESDWDYTQTYPDTGCGGACIRSLECPYPVCLEDEGRTQRRRRLIAARHDTIRSLRNQGTPIEALARQFHLSARSLYRITSPPAC